VGEERHRSEQHRDSFSYGLCGDGRLETLGNRTLSESRLQRASYFALRTTQGQGVYPAPWPGALPGIAWNFAGVQKFERKAVSKV